MLVATHKRCGKQHRIKEVIEDNDFFVRCILDTGTECWIGKEAYTITKEYEVTEQQVEVENEN